MVLIGGDFNTDPGRNNAQNASLTDFLERNSLICSWDLPCADKNNSASQTVYTYKTHDSHMSCIDHFMISSSYTYSARSVAVLDYTACSKDYGHFPICINFTLSAPRENKYYCNDIKCVSEKMLKMQWCELWEPYIPVWDKTYCAVCYLICVSPPQTPLCQKWVLSANSQVDQKRCSHWKTSQLCGGQYGKRMGDHTLA